MSEDPIPPESDESELIRRIRDGETHLYESIVVQYQRRLYATILGMVGSREDAEDLTQESLVMAYRKLHLFEGRSSFFTWLQRIAMNLAISHRRKHRTEKSQTWTSMEVAIDEIHDRDPKETSLLEQQEQLDLVHQALARLDETYRSILVLRDVQQLDYSQISDILAIPIGTVRSRLHRARLELRDILQMLSQRQN